MPARAATVSAAPNSNRRDVLQAIRRVLAADCACEEHDLLDEGIVVTEARELPGRRRYPFPSRPLLVVTMGAGVVVSCDRERVEWARANLSHLRRDELFGAITIGRMAAEVERGGQYLVGPVLKYACSQRDLRPADAPPGIEIISVEGDEIVDLYKHKGFEDALSYRTDTPRPDVMATVAMRAGEICGIAGASADSEELWQIGVGVVEAMRGRGVGRALVGRLTAGVLDAGKVPHYSTTVSNLRSRAVAISLGYWPAWTELHAMDL